MSLGAGVVCDLPVNKYIRNVEGSAKDPLPFDPSNKHGWLGLWKKETRWDESVYGKIRCCTCGREDGWTDTWGSPHIMVGGHIVLGAEADAVSGSGAAPKQAGNLRGGNRIFIAPICSECNGQSGDMLVVAANKIVQLCGFFGDSDGRVEVDAQMWHEKEARRKSGEGETYRNYYRYKRIYFKRVDEFRQKAAEIVKSQTGLTRWDYDYLKSSAVSQPATAAGASTQSVSVAPGKSSARSRPSRYSIPKDVRYNYGRTGFDYGEL